MFFGAISSARSGESFWRRIRLRSAIATARFAAACPTTYLSSSATICRGVSDSADVWVVSGSGMATSLQFFDHNAGVRVDADVSGDLHRLLGYRTRVEIGVVGECLGCGKRVRA